MVIDRIDPISHKISFKSSIVDQEFTPEFDQLAHAFAKQIGTSNNVDMNDLSLMQLSALGKNNLTFEATYNGITDFSAKNLTGRQSHLIIPQFDYSNRLQSGKMHGSLNFITQEETHNNWLREGSIDFKGSYLASPEMKDYLIASYSDMAKLMLANPIKDQTDENNQLKLLLAQIFLKHADIILPDFAKIGEMKYAFDLKFDDAAKSILLNEFSLALPKYGWH